MEREKVTKHRLIIVTKLLDFSIIYHQKIIHSRVIVVEDDNNGKKVPALIVKKNDN
jgi:hypothetical protein